MASENPNPQWGIWKNQHFRMSQMHCSPKRMLHICLGATLVTEVEHSLEFCQVLRRWLLSYFSVFCSFSFLKPKEIKKWFKICGNLSPTLQISPMTRQLTNSFVKITFAQPICFIWVSKALVKWTRKSTQVNASLQKENLRTDLRRVAANGFASLTGKSQKAVIYFTHIID